MRVPHGRITARTLGLAVAAMALILPASVAASTNEPIAQTGGMTATFPLLGTSLTVGVSLDTVGNIAGVTLDPADALPTTTTDHHGVKFENADGTAKVTVEAKHDKLEIKAKTTLAGLLGSGTWSSNVFGTGTTATVTYTIGLDTDGGPTLVVDSATASDGIGVVVNDPAPKGPGDKGPGDKGPGKHPREHARAEVVFSLNGYSKTLTLEVAAHRDGKAELKIRLSGKDKQKAEGTLESLLGDRTWSAHLCDGTPVTVAYHVAADGTVVFDGSTGAPATDHARKDGLTVRFDGTKVGLDVKLKQHKDGNWVLDVKGKSGDCEGPHGDKPHTDASPTSHHAGSRHHGAASLDARFGGGRSGRDGSDDKGSI